jgi:hypothetical protein
MKILFAGPSLHRDLHALREEDGLVLRGPARCGDIARAVEKGAAAIGLVDGLFDQTASPWHKEILHGLSRGVRIAGGASMGALRAAECSAFGMIGIGAIYRGYATGHVTDDADVAQLHGPAEMGYLPLTEPWVNVAPTLARMAAASVVDPASVRRLRETARALHFTRRTYPEMVVQTSGLFAGESEIASHWLREHAVDQKRIDARAVVDWLRAQPNIRDGADRAWQFQETTHWLGLLSSLGEGAA